MKKVLFVSTVVKLHINVFHTPFLKWFKDNGYMVHVAAKNDYEQKEDCYIPYCDKFYDIPFERSPLNLDNLRSVRKLKKIIDANDYDIIHCHTPVGGAVGRLASINARKKGTRVLYTAHGFHFYKGAPFSNWLFFYPAEKFLSRYTDTLITINHEDYKRAKRFKKTNVVYVPGVGINTENISDIKIDKEKKRKELKIPENSFLLVSVGELSKRKNHEVIIRAIGKIGNKNIHYIICGQGELQNKLRNISYDLKIEKQIHFLGFRKDIFEILLVSDLFVFSSYQEGLPVALMEAMAAGLPVVASDIRGNSDLITKKGGYLLSPEDINGFSKAIIKIYNEPIKTRENMGTFNKNQIKKYDIDNVLTKMAEIYNN